MVVEAQRLPYESLARAAERLAGGEDMREPFELLAEAVLVGTGAELVVVRVLDDDGVTLVARAVAPGASPLAAEAAGSRCTLDQLVEDRPGSVVFTATAANRVVGAIEVLPRGGKVEAEGRTLAELAAAQLGLALSARGAAGPAGEGRPAATPGHELERAGDALAAGADVSRAAHQVVRLAAEATGARAAAVWRATGARLEPIALYGDWPATTLELGRSAAAEVLVARDPVVVCRDDADPCVVSIQLGQPPFGVLQARYVEEPPAQEIAALSSFAGRASHALRLGQRARDTEAELERTRALLSVVGEAIARLSVAHTLETSVERIADLLSLDRVGIYLREEGRLVSAAGRNLEAGHEEVASGLLELALGPMRAREAIEVRRGSNDPVEVPLARLLEAAGAEAALAVPLRVRDETIGLLVAYPGKLRLTDDDLTLLASLAAQLAVAVQNARLHERTKELGDALGSVLASERQAARRLGALYEISSAFAGSRPLERTIELVTATIVDVLGIDAAAISVPDERGDTLIPQAVHVADLRLVAPVQTILERPQPARAWAGSKPVVLDPVSAKALGGGHELLVPFLEKGSTAVVLPISSPTELLALLTILSLDPASPISQETIDTATTIAAQVALAIDNARLHQQQKAFAETIQRALLPRSKPVIDGIEIGAVYQSAARVDVGGDLYDFLELDDGRLAIVLGDVTGHGVDATADMAMAKFVFRSLAREHGAPGDFLHHANEVIAEEIAVGKFITMAYVLLDPRGHVAAAGAGHPPPRLVLPDGTVESLECRGLALGIDTAQEYAELEAELPTGASIVLYTDGVIEARTDSDLFGTERLDEYLREHRALPAQELADGVLAACRAFAGGDLADDAAVVIARKT